MNSRILLVVFAFALVLAACNALLPPPEPTPTTEPTPLPDTPTPEATPLPDTPTPEPTPLPDTPTPVQPTPTETPAATPTPPLEPDPRPEEEILILEPGPGSRVLSPVRVAGEADSTFEQNLVVRIILDDGIELVQVSTTIQADLGLRGPFEVEVPFTVTGERQAFIQIYSTSARDGGITHLSSVGITIADAGEESIVMGERQPERIAIFQPETAATITGGVAHVEGFALASFEQALLVEVLDEEGNVVGMQPIMVQAPDMGIPGPYNAEVPYTITTAQPGRIVVRDISPAHGDNAHLASVEVRLEP